MKITLRNVLTVPAESGYIRVVLKRRGSRSTRQPESRPACDEQNHKRRALRERQSRMNHAVFLGGSVMRRKSHVIVAALALLCLLPFSSSAFGQAVYGSIYGTVTDASGAVVPGATVTVTDVAKGTSVKVQTN